MDTNVNFDIKMLDIRIKIVGSKNAIRQTI